ncbi:MAG: hypothetical protein LBI78_05205 [Campylobacteraceae bacterium]|nr:hypothetical protein [Campylobacteraceae bacterium]
MKIFSWLLLSAVVLSIVGCASLVNKDTQPVIISTNDLKSATVTVTHKDGTQSGKTPFVVSVRRANQPLIVSVEESKCTKATTIEKNATVSGVFFVNAIWCFSCLFSTTTDAATGRMWKYDEQIVVPVERISDCSDNT